MEGGFIAWLVAVEPGYTDGDSILERALNRTRARLIDVQQRVVVVRPQECPERHAWTQHPFMVQRLVGFSPGS
jgi:hypothetical protein